ncbi:hypothetical protein [Methylosinus sp. H3A]|uniref:hypothetical protein n=1 Tax=Methylosinus sp. H3A TaxID=2785786 RepID=UPI001FF01C7A|nr:hypothetical protein [Methylosinus sp. H3A]
MRCLGVAILMMTLVAPCHANDVATPNGEIIVGGGAPPTPVARTCVDVQIGGDLAFGCLNRRLRRDVERVRPIIEAPPVDARSSDLKTGVVNMPAIRQQYGRNFGISAVPYREPTVNAGSPTLRR